LFRQTAPLAVAVYSQVPDEEANGNGFFHATFDWSG
jgi:hypothetical protein